MSCESPTIAGLPNVSVESFHRRREWLTILTSSWRFGRTKIGVALFLVVLGVALLGPYVSPYSPTEFVGRPFAGPSAKIVLGTDNLGRDVLSRVLWGGRTVFALSIAATMVGMALGTTLGLLAGYAREWVDELIMRLLDVVLAFPIIVFVLLVVSVAGPKPWLIVLSVGIASAPRIARVARGATLEVAQREFVEAAEADGVARTRILASEILPNITSPLLVEFGLRFAYSIAIIAALSFLGFGLQPPAADWGLMINENRVGLAVQPYSILVPVVLIGLVTIGTNMAADGLNRAIIGIERPGSK